MKNLLALVIILSLSLTACETTCDLTNAPAACSEVVPTDEACQAAFERWFYDKNSNNCEKISYSGCSQWGFATEVECETCVCVSQ